MKANKTHLRALLFLGGALMLLALSACQGSATPDPTSAAEIAALESTVASLEAGQNDLSTSVAQLEQTQAAPPPQTPTVQVPPTLTPTLAPTVTPTFGPTLSVPEGQESVVHSKAPGYVFILDTEVWTVTNTTVSSDDFLSNTRIANCLVRIAPPAFPVDLVAYAPQEIGNRNWLVETYAERSFYVFKQLRLDLPASEDVDCAPAQEGVLTSMLTLEEFSGAPTATPFIAPTPRPPVEGFTCANAPISRLRVGDRVLIIAGSIWLRSEPRVSEETQQTLYTQYAPREFVLTDGPVCADDFVFWKVSVKDLVSGVEVAPGWMAESGQGQYLLDLWNVGW